MARDDDVEAAFERAARRVRAPLTRAWWTGSAREAREAAQERAPARPAPAAAPPPSVPAPAPERASPRAEPRPPAQPAAAPPRAPVTVLPAMTVTAQAPRRSPPPQRAPEGSSEADVLNDLELERIRRQNEGLPGAEVGDLWGRPAGYAHGGRIKGARMNRSGRMR